jgi:quercetin dioxygenase-like cupin family protein
MKHVNAKDVNLEPVNIEGAVGANIKWLIGEKDGAANFYMRMFVVDVDGNTPYHTHAFEHEIFVLEGSGKIVLKESAKAMNPYDVIYVPPNIEHQFVNIGDKPLVFLCLVPNEQKQPPKQNPFSSGKANNC